MRIAIISDLHLGDPMSVMAAMDKKKQLKVGAGYNKFITEVKQRFVEPLKEDSHWLDYLVLLGDVLDFSIASYRKAYAVGQCFFKQLKEDKIAGEIIYLPGNHDFDIWHTVEYQVNVINKILNGKTPELFRMSVPGLIDDRSTSTYKGLYLHNVTRRPHKIGYGGLFLDEITKPKNTIFNFVYPNLYLVTDTESILITHGHYLEMYWSILGKLAFKIINGDMNLNDKKGLNLKEMVGINFPSNQLASSGVGQAAPLTDIIRALEHELKDSNFERLKKYINSLWDQLSINWFLKKILVVLSWLFDIRGKIFDAIRKMMSSRYDKEFLENEEVKERFREFYLSTKAEINDIITNEPKIKHFLLSKMIFGHTHQPISWGDQKAPHIELDGNMFWLYNSGGWLIEKGKLCGAEIFFYETHKGISSVRVDQL